MSLILSRYNPINPIVTVIDLSHSHYIRYTILPTLHYFTITQFIVIVIKFKIKEQLTIKNAISSNAHDTSPASTIKQNGDRLEIGP